MNFACMPAFDGDETEVILLAKSIRRRAGQFAQAELLIMEPAQSPLSPGARKALARMEATVIPFRLPENALAFPYAQKVFAAAEAERSLGAGLLAWMDSDTLVLEEPEAFSLPQEKAIGCCPVQLKNISASAGSPPGAFWQAVYAGCGAPMGRVFLVTTTVDQERILAHFNAGLLVVRPEAGLLQAWAENFARLYTTAVFQPFFSVNRLYQIFFHQAVLAATLLARLPEDAFCLFPERYNAAVFLRRRFPKITAKPITCRYDEFAFFQDPQWTSGAADVDEKIAALLQN